MLDGRVAIVTGGTKGLGLAIAAALLREGATVTINGRDESRGYQVADTLGERARFVPGDVTKQSHVEQLIDSTVEQFGRLDILVNNAGGGAGLQHCVDLSDEAWSLAMDWNLNSTFWATRRALRHMIPQRGGRIVNISSVEGKLGRAAMTAYTAAKHGVNGFTKAVAQEVGEFGITVNALCPGLIITDAILERGPATAAAMGLTFEEMVASYTSAAAIRRPVRVEEVAAMALLVCSDAGAGISGALLSVDGGTAMY